MFILQRLAQDLRSHINPWRDIRKALPTPPLASNHFSSSSISRLNLRRHRFYSNGYGYRAANQAPRNLVVLYSLMGVNLAVGGYALYTKAQAQHGFPKAFSTFVHTWTCNLTNVVKQGAWWQPLTSTFVHIDVWHLATNMLTAYFIGQFLCYAPIITPSRFLTIALGAGVTGGLGYLTQRWIVTGGTGIDSQRGLGFSGALMGITSVAACLAPTTKIYIYGVIPVPLWGLVAGYAFYDGYYLNDSSSRVGHSGHLGGLAFGIAYYVLKLRGRTV